MNQTSEPRHPLPSPPDYAITIKVSAQRPVAINSLDHIYPHGTRRDNSRNPRFNEKLYWLLQAAKNDLAILDLGCSGGGFVRECLNDGCLAVGLEGSDFSQKRHRAEWAVIPQYLFVCDVTAPFQITARAGGRTSFEQLTFDVVTSWELLEHIAESDLSALAENVRRHLKPGGLWIVSVSPHSDKPGHVELHQTVRPREWWIEKLGQLGFQHLDGFLQFFNSQFVRGPKFGAPESFNLVLCAEPNLAPGIPRVTLSGRLFDFWNGSAIQKALNRFIVG